jgi:prepilin-type N-terminal cleavage/methylation domain-containing protein
MNGTLRRGGFTLIEVMIVAGITATLAAIAIPIVLAGVRSANERNASASLKTLMSAEIDFKENDRDGNGIRDFWTADVAGLYSMTSAAVRGRKDDPIRLLNVTVAGADTSPLSAGSAGGEYRAITEFAFPAPKAEYWYYAMNQDQGASPAQSYRQNTGGLLNMGNVHHLYQFAFMAYPNRYKYSGTSVFIINEAGTLMKSNPGRSIKSRESAPPGAPISAFRNWPNDRTLKASWSKMD